jgi:hypothetical protein
LAIDRGLRPLYAGWAFAVVMWAVLAVSTTFATGRENYLLLFAIAGTLGFVFFQRQLVHRKQWLLLRAPNSDSLIAYYAKLIRTSVPNGDVSRAHASAVAATCFGEFDKADEIMASIDWSGRGNLWEALPLHVRALTTYWRDHNYELGLALATRGRKMAEIPRHLPGSAMSRLSWDVLVSIGEVLADRPTPETIAVLETGRAKLPFVSGLMATWGLAVAHQRAGRTKEASELVSQLRAAAPHCRPLVEIPTAESHESSRHLVRRPHAEE